MAVSGEEGEASSSQMCKCVQVPDVGDSCLWCPPLPTPRAPLLPLGCPGNTGIDWLTPMHWA